MTQQKHKLKYARVLLETLHTRGMKTVTGLQSSVARGHRKRTQFEIIAEILRVAKNGGKKTRIMYSCNLNYPRTRRFLTYLLEAGLLRKGKSFHTTEKGLQFLQAYQTLELLLNTRN